MGSYRPLLEVRTAFETMTVTQPSEVLVAEAFRFFVRLNARRSVQNSQFHHITNITFHYKGAACGTLGKNGVSCEGGATANTVPPPPRSLWPRIYFDMASTSTPHSHLSAPVDYPCDLFTTVHRPAPIRDIIVLSHFYSSIIT